MLASEKQVPYLACASLPVTYPTASAGPDQAACVTDSAQLPVLLRQLRADLADPAVIYLLYDAPEVLSAYVRQGRLA